MRNKFHKYIALSLALIFSGACTDKFNDINTDPSSFLESSWDPNFTFTTAQLNYTGSQDLAYETWRVNLAYGSTMMQGFASINGVLNAGDRYVLNPGWSSAYFGEGSVGAYAEQVKLIVDVVEFTRDNEAYVNLHQAARITQALVFERITDIYGDVPYFDAGKGYRGDILTPKYDKQEEIYNDLIKEIRDAVNKIGSGRDDITGDLFYDGNIEKWKRFGNSLLLRVGMRLTKVNPTLAAEIAAEVDGKTFESNADNAFVQHSESGHRVTKNRNSQILSPLGEGGQAYQTRWSETFIDWLQDHNDPRLSKIAATNVFELTEEEGSPKWGGWNAESEWNFTPADQIGMPNGKENNDVAGYGLYEGIAGGFNQAEYLNSFSAINPKMLKLDGKTFVLTYAETELLLADAANRGWIGSDAKTHYDNGVKSAMTYLVQYDASMEISEGDADAYLAANPYDGTLEQINTQYWAHAITMLDFYEAWSNWRRTSYPNLVPVVSRNNDTGGTIPRRMVYTTDEAAKNGANLQEAVSRIPGGDNLTGRVWWDKE